MNKEVLKEIDKLKHGQYITCRIGDTVIKDARIQKLDNYYFSCYIIHNNGSCNGARSDFPQWGYKYSWNIDSSVTEIKGLDRPFTVHKVKVTVRPQSPRIYMGADPEFFFMEKGEVLGAEKVLDKSGIKLGDGKVIIDGVQAELNPEPSYCREILANRIGRLIHSSVGLCKKGVTLSFDPLVPISLNSLNSLSDKAKHFGCTPSYNVYKDMPVGITDSSQYPFRPAGGHIHLGWTDKSNKAVLNDVNTLVPLLDIIVGNTCVLLDRHEGNVERRKNYGRAGEFRTPKHGLEYRTLSNFWLTSYPLMSFVFGLARMTVEIAQCSIKGDEDNDFVARIMGAVDQQDIIRAINNNDFDLALKNFAKIKPILSDILHEHEYPLFKGVMLDFLYFVMKIKRGGLGYWFKEDPTKVWIRVATVDRGLGWESFLERIVRKERLAKKK